MRPVRWRWDRATVLSHGVKIKGTELDDEKVVEAAKYIKKYRAVTDKIGDDDTKDSEAELLDVRKQWPDLMTAASIYTGAEFMKWAIEALICANATADDIASTFGVETSVIQSYEDFFFDVRSRLGNEMWVAHALLSPAMCDGMATVDCDFFWKSLALWHGAEVLKGFWTTGELPEGVDEKIMALTKGIQLRNVAKAQLVRPVTPGHAHDIIDEANVGKQDESNEARDLLMLGAGQMLNAMTFRIASQTQVPEAIERPLEAIEGKVTAEDGVPALPDGGVMAGRTPQDIPEHKPTPDDEAETVDEKPSTAVESKKKVEPTPEPHEVLTADDNTTPASVEEEREAANARIRKKKEEILAKRRKKIDKQG
jgi:hypothetical protein